MTLRRKLLTALGGLAALALLAAGVAVYITLRWQGATEENRAHYLRSLALETVRADTFQALAEVNDALAGSSDDYADARDDFERALATTEADFEEWQRLADEFSETAKVAEVRATYARLIANARRVFELLDGGQRDEAVRLVDDELDTGDYAAFRAVTEKAVAADVAIRQRITAETDRLRQTALVMSAVAMLAAFSLTLLIAAYLSQDLFRPLASLHRSLDALADGAMPERLAVDRRDEIGLVAASFNRAADAMEQQSRLPNASADGGTGPRGALDPDRRGAWQASLDRIRSALAELRQGEMSDATARLDEIEAGAEALARSAAIAQPLDLRLEPLDPRLVAQEALSSLGPILAARGVSCECNLDPDAGHLLADRLKLRAVLDEALKAALAALPEVGGRIGVRVSRDATASSLFIDVADSGAGSGRIVSPADFDEGAETPNLPKEMGLHAMRAVLSSHGGNLEIAGRGDEGSVTRMAFPLRS